MLKSVTAITESLKGYIAPQQASCPLPTYVAVYGLILKRSCQCRQQPPDYMQQAGCAYCRAEAACLGTAGDVYSATHCSSPAVSGSACLAHILCTRDLRNINMVQRAGDVFQYDTCTLSGQLRQILTTGRSCVTSSLQNKAETHVAMLSFCAVPVLIRTEVRHKCTVDSHLRNQLSADPQRARCPPPRYIMSTRGTTMRSSDLSMFITARRRKEILWSSLPTQTGESIQQVRSGMASDPYIQAVVLYSDGEMQDFILRKHVGVSAYMLYSELYSTGSFPAWEGLCQRLTQVMTQSRSEVSPSRLLQLH